MKVSELIELLQYFSSDLPVMIDGDVGGLLDLENFRQSRVALEYHRGSIYYGPHQEVDEFHEEESFTDLDHEDNDGQTYQVIDALLISR